MRKEYVLLQPDLIEAKEKGRRSGLKGLKLEGRFRIKVLNYII
jgi:hypothetical protein